MGQNRVMKLKDVPKAPAYLVNHDVYDDGAMEIWPCQSIEQATNIATFNQDQADSMGYENVNWRAYTKLPRIRVWKFHPEGK